MSPNAQRRNDAKIEPAEIGASAKPQIPSDIVPMRVVATDELEELLEVSIADAQLARVPRKSLLISQSRLTSVDFTESRLTGFRATDAAFENCNFSNVYLTGAFTRASFAQSKLSGIQARECSFNDVEFRECRFDYASFGNVRFKRITFDNCQLREADFSATAFDRVRFVDCDLKRATFSRMQIVRSEMRTCALEALRGLGELRGVAMGWNDILAHADLFAAELGIEVR